MALAQRADRIVRLVEGRVVDTRRRDGLCGRNELYQWLCDLQVVQPTPGS